VSAFLGIDPGLDGAVVLVGEDGAVKLAALCPVLRVKKSRREYDVRAMAHLLQGIGEPIHHAALERPSSRPGQGRVSIFSTGRSGGLWEGILATFGVAYELPTPATWMRMMFSGIAASGEGKARSILAARQLLPGLDLTPGRRTKPHDGLADAGLLALYARRRWGA